MSDDQLPPSPTPEDDGKIVPMTPGGANDGGGGGEKKSRRGKVTKSKNGEAAEFKPGAAAKPEKFDPAKIVESLNIWWEAEGGDSFWVNDANGWAKWPKDALLDLCMESAHKVARKKRDGEFMPEGARLLVYLRTHRRVDGVMWGLAGYHAGLHTMPSGERVIVRNSPKPVQPEAGDWALVKELIEGRLDLFRDAPVVPGSDNDGVSDEEQRAAIRAANIVSDQVIYFHAWHKTVLQSLLNGSPGSWTPRPLLALAGPHSCGKSRLQIMVTNGLLGGRVANPKAYLTGKENFNANMVKAEHLMMEELDNVSQKMVDRLAFSESMKAVVANSGVTLRLMRTDPMTIMPFWAPTLSMNNDPDKLRSFPPLTPDFRDKVIMLLVRRAPLPMPSRTDDEKKAFNAAIAAQLPAYAHWLLNEFEVPAELLKDADGEDATRFGCRSFQHPSLANELFDDSPAAELLAIVDSAVFGSLATNTKLWDIRSDFKTLGDAWEGSAIDLERLLVGDVEAFPCSSAREAKRLFVHTRCDRLLGRLAEDRPERVLPHRT
ncbi:MAG: hypothetical protein ABMA13_16160, partial [Chthoniobacteraceae bacterium]